MIFLLVDTVHKKLYPDTFFEHIRQRIYRVQQYTLFAFNTIYDSFYLKYLPTGLPVTSFIYKCTEKSYSIPLYSKFEDFVDNVDFIEEIKTFLKTSENTILYINTKEQFDYFNENYEVVNIQFYKCISNLDFLNVQFDYVFTNFENTANFIKQNN